MVEVNLFYCLEVDDSLQLPLVAICVKKGERSGDNDGLIQVINVVTTLQFLNAFSEVS